MFELKISKGTLLTILLGAIKDLVGDAFCTFSAKEFFLQAMDKGRFGTLSILLRSNAFEHYRCDRGFSMEINVFEVMEWVEVADTTMDTKFVTFSADDGSNVVNMRMDTAGGEKPDVHLAEIEMQMIDIDTDLIGVPERDYDAIVRVDFSKFALICQSFCQFGDTVTLTVSDQGFLLSIKGDIGAATAFLTDQPKDATIIRMREPVKRSFALKSISAFTEATSELDSHVTIGLSAAGYIPMLMEYNIVEFGHVRYYLPPKREEEELGCDPQPRTRGGPEAESSLATDRNPEGQPDPEDDGKLEAEEKPDVEIKEETEAGTGEETHLETETEADDIVARIQKLEIDWADLGSRGS